MLILYNKSVQNGILKKAGDNYNLPKNVCMGTYNGVQYEV